MRDGQGARAEPWDEVWSRVWRSHGEGPRPKALHVGLTARCPGFCLILLCRRCARRHALKAPRPYRCAHVGLGSSPVVGPCSGSAPPCPLPPTLRCSL